MRRRKKPEDLAGADRAGGRGGDYIAVRERVYAPGEVECGRQFGGKTVGVHGQRSRGGVGRPEDLAEVRPVQSHLVLVRPRHGTPLELKASVRGDLRGPEYKRIDLRCAVAQRALLGLA